MYEYLLLLVNFTPFAVFSLAHACLQGSHLTSRWSYWHRHGGKEEALDPHFQWSWQVWSYFSIRFNMHCTYIILKCRYLIALICYDYHCFHMKTWVNKCIYSQRWVKVVVFFNLKRTPKWCYIMSKVWLKGDSKSWKKVKFLYVNVLIFIV